MSTLKTQTPLFDGPKLCTVFGRVYFYDQSSLRPSQLVGNIRTQTTCPTMPIYVHSQRVFIIITRPLLSSWSMWVTLLILQIYITTTCSRCGLPTKNFRWLAPTTSTFLSHLWILNPWYHRLATSTLKIVWKSFAPCVKPYRELILWNGVKRRSKEREFPSLHFLFYNLTQPAMQQQRVERLSLGWLEWAHLFLVHFQLFVMTKLYHYGQLSFITSNGQILVASDCE